MDELDNKEPFSVDYTEIKNLEVGKTYPFYGMITKILKEDDGLVTEIELNHYILARINSNSVQYSDILRRRVFEPGIFMAELEKKCEPEDEYDVEINCTLIIFGKQPEQQVQ